MKAGLGSWGSMATIMLLLPKVACRVLHSGHTPVVTCSMKLLDSILTRKRYFLQPQDDSLSLGP
jgi:hypothetical protein